jgi:hypothetical protein
VCVEKKEEEKKEKEKRKKQHDDSMRLVVVPGMATHVRACPQIASSGAHRPPTNNQIESIRP